MIRSKYTPEMILFITEQYATKGIADVVVAFNEKFNSKLTISQAKSAIKNHKITCGRTTGEIRKGVFIAYTNEQAMFIREQYKLITLPALTQLFNETFGTEKTPHQIRAFTRNHGIKSGRSGCFTKDSTPWNSGMKGWKAGGRSAESRFKPGRKSENIRPVGSTRIRSKDGYIMLKTAEPSTWRPMHVVAWENSHGKVPTGCRLWFKDNDRTNCDIDNLMLITKAQSAVINKNGLGQVPSELKASAVFVADIAMRRAQLIKAGVAA